MIYNFFMYADAYMKKYVLYKGLPPLYKNISLLLADLDD